MSDNNSGPAIEAVELVKTYGKGDKAVQALRGVSFAAPAGTIYGLLGPNGAGKSTIVKVLTTLAAPDSGTATVAGIDVAAHPAQVRHVIGYVPQKPSFDPNSTGRENLVLQGKIYGLSKARLRERVDEMLQRFGLTEAADRVTLKWSGGMQRKLDVALALVHEPKVLFLDEPTTGLDPAARTELWSEISTLTRSGDLTVLLTTHYLEEADQLADHLVIVDRGQVVASGTPEHLKDDLAGDTIAFKLPTAKAALEAREALGSVQELDEIIVEVAELRARAAKGSATLPPALAALEAAGVPVVSVTVARPSLDQVYLRHAGRSYSTDGR